jgi:nitrate reductase gamma subunit
MENELLFRNIVSILVLASLPALLLLLKELYHVRKTSTNSDSIQLVLLVIYLTFLFSGLITLYINIQVVFFHSVTNQYTQLAMIRNIIKQVGIVFVSWRLYLLTREGGEK